MAFLFVVNVIVVSMVVREVCGTTTKETPAEVTEISKELEVIELTSEDERATLETTQTGLKGQARRSPSENHLVKRRRRP